LEELRQSFSFPDQVRQQVNNVLSEVSERHYLCRFPGKLLWLFRYIGILGLPLTYILVIIGILIFTLLFILLESATVDVPDAIMKNVPLILVVVLIIFPLIWGYRLIYSTLGKFIVRGVGRKIIEIGQEQPHLITTSSFGITYQKGSAQDDSEKHAKDSFAWADLLAFVSVNYYQGQSSLSLFSYTLLTAKSGKRIMINALTTNYKHLLQNIAYHLKNTGNIIQHSVDFIIFENRSTVAVIIIALTVALIAIAVGPHLRISHELQKPNTYSPPQQAPVTTFFLIYTMNLLSGISVSSLWRLLFHQHRVRKQLNYASKAIPLWIVWFLTIVFTLIAGLWIAFLVMKIFT
jgi:hypothetical protein